MIKQIRPYLPQATRVARAINRTVISRRWPDRERARKAGLAGACDAVYIREQAELAAKHGPTSNAALKIAEFGRRHAARLIEMYGPYEGRARAALGLDYAIRYCAHAD